MITITPQISLNSSYDQMIETTQKFMKLCFKPKKSIIKSNKTNSNITNLLKIKSKMFKKFKETNDKFWLMCGNFYYDLIKKTLETNHSLKCEKLIEKSNTHIFMYNPGG